ncbi:hypothetical protein NL676_029645 [Syzygium grande]|nr:hypothetical protein NL676_029645 [Syzygium grande]
MNKERAPLEMNKDGKGAGPDHGLHAWLGKGKASRKRETGRSRGCQEWHGGVSGGRTAEGRSAEVAASCCQEEKEWLAKKVAGTRGRAASPGGCRWWDGVGRR